MEINAPRRGLRWAKIPTAWIRYDDGLKAFSTTESGTNSVALKIYMALSLHAPYRTKSSTIIAGQTKLTYDEFETLTGASRTMIARAIDKLRAEGRIQVLDESKAHSYEIIGYEDESRGWGKLPKDYLLAGGASRHGRLSALGHRHRVDLNALKIYLALIAFRDGSTGYSRLSYEKISEHTGILRNHVRPALTSLFDAHLIGVDRDSDEAVGAHASNCYVVIGLAGRRNLASPNLQNSLAA